LGNEILKCSIKDWAAWSPGLDTKQDWQNWFSNGESRSDENSPDISFMPRMLRRRLSRMTKMALYVAEQCAKENKDLYNIFCSGRGEYDHSFKVLNEICSGEDVSPASFGASVHNTSQGLFSIFQSNQQPALFLSGHSNTLEQAISVACAKLVDGEEQVLVVYHDDILPGIYLEDAQALKTPLALALLLEKENMAPILDIKHTSNDTSDDTSNDQENSALMLIKLILGSGTSSTFQQSAWTWGIKSA
jgi:hypothetical protein